MRNCPAHLVLGRHVPMSIWTVEWGGVGVECRAPQPELGEGWGEGKPSVPEVGGSKSLSPLGQRALRSPSPSFPTPTQPPHSARDDIRTAGLLPWFATLRKEPSKRRTTLPCSIVLPLCLSVLPGGKTAQATTDCSFSAFISGTVIGRHWSTSLTQPVHRYVTLFCVSLEERALRSHCFNIWKKEKQGRG